MASECCFGLCGRKKRSVDAADSGTGGPVTPDYFNCGHGNLDDMKDMDCCPPVPLRIIDFVPPVVQKLRVRPAIHQITPQLLKKFEDGVEKMKRLDANDPRNFYQQANVHCAYCTGAYKVEGFPRKHLDVHWGWLFFPFHRCFIYFFERILGHLIGDPDFVLPFWNWDAPHAMQIPSIFTDPNSPLFDEFRDPRHQPPKLMNLAYDGVTEDSHCNVSDCNLRLMYRQMMINGKTALGFHGQPFRATSEEISIKGAGSIEWCPHDNVHDWVGNPNCENRKNMGNFATAARDPVFFGHHANVDRMWNIWQQLGNGKRRDFRDTDWLDSSFVFYDENKNAVRIKVRDCVDSKQLGYVYQEVDIPWKDSKPIPALLLHRKILPVGHVRFPVDLSSKISTMVKRPKKKEKGNKEEEEVLMIEDIQFSTDTRAHFNVLINVFGNDDEANSICPGNTQFAGTFRSILHGHTHHVRTSLALHISEAIHALGLDHEEAILVTLISKLGGRKVTIGGIKIELQDPSLT